MCQILCDDPVFIPASDLFNVSDSGKSPIFLLLKNNDHFDPLLATEIEEDLANCVDLD